MIETVTLNKAEPRNIRDLKKPRCLPRYMPIVTAFAKISIMATEKAEKVIVIFSDEKLNLNNNIVIYIITQLIKNVNKNSTK